VVDPIEACLDVSLEHPVVFPTRCSEIVDLGDGVLSPALRAETVRTRLEIRLEDRLEHQLERGLHDPVKGRRDPKAADFSRRFGDRRLLHSLGNESACFEIFSQPAK
jgi:hypothetical protein